MMKEKARRSKIGKSLSLVAAALLVAVVSLTACAPPQPAQPLPIRVGWLTVTDSLPYFVIIDQNLDKKYGFQVTETNYSGGSAIINDLATDNLDLGAAIGIVPVLGAAQSGIIPGKVIPAAAIDFAGVSNPLTAILVNQAINSWQDLQGKQIGVNSLASLNAASIITRLRQEGIQDYKLVVIDFPNMGLALAGGNIDAGSIVEPYLTQSLLRQDGKLLSWIIGGPPLENIENTMLVFSSSFYKDKPQIAKAYLKAHLEAVKWISQNPEKARAVLGKRLSLTPEVISKVGLPRYSLDGRNDPALLQSTQQVLIDVGMLKAPIPVNQLYDETLLNEVLAEKR